MLLGTVLIVLDAAVPAGLTAVSGSGLALTADRLAQVPLDLAKRTPLGNLPGLAASRATVPGFSGFEREVVVSDYGPPASCSNTPCSASCPRCRGSRRAAPSRSASTIPGPLGDTTTALTQVFAK
jgi:hypothetical protein